MRTRTPQPYVDFEPITIDPAAVRAAIDDPSCLREPAEPVPYVVTTRSGRKAVVPSGVTLWTETDAA